ncbi:flagellar biosynthesis protein FliZ [Priestia megaterium]|uniref:Flagellar biosynthesis protein FliZ n=1 Tax=Priestia megaterium TaxID=1404 RepID=A0A3D8WYY3_PRIMG|nr:flagellar biosynthetic protein FliO [Priestia megaterium]MDH3171887.1 flagellar biosynthetic protein FliO [Priestia megaterium]RDZ11871.1 flagellar biosynthesis protein FliZ [Priestia megaterium]
MLRKFVIAALLISVLAGSNQIVYAESGSASVKECLEKTEKCSESKSTDSKEKTELQGAPTLSAGDIVKMIFAFLLVIGLLFALLKFVNKKGRLLQKNKVVQNLGGTNVGSSKSVQVVKVGNQLFIIGVGENVQLLSEITGQGKQQLLTQYDEQQKNEGEYKVVLPSFLEKLTSKKEEKFSHSFQQLFQREMNEMKIKRQNVLKELERNKKKDE